MFNVDKIKKELESRGLDANSFDYLYNYLKSNDLLDKLSDYTNRLLKGEAVQYIIGNVDFYGYEFKVNSNTLIPRFETELLVEKSVNYINNFFEDRVSILDIGTGSGCIAITLNKLLNSCDITGIDISSEALEVAKENNISNNTNVKFIESDIFSNVSDKYDVIISNPPYISYGDTEVMDIVKNNEPHLALYAKDNGLYFYDKIIKDSSKYLNDKFIMAFEIGYKQRKDITKIVNKYYKDINMSVEKDYSGRDRFVFIWNH